MGVMSWCILKIAFKREPPVFLPLAKENRGLAVWPGAGWNCRTYYQIPV